MKFLALNFPVFLLDVAPDRPFTFGVLGIGGAIGFGLLLSAIAVGAFLLFRKSLPIAARAVIAGFLFLIAAGSFSFAALAVYSDSQAEIEYRETLRRNNEARRRRNEERMRRQEERETEINSNLQTNSNLSTDSNSRRN